MRRGRCYELALRLALENDDVPGLTLVHGFVRGPWGSPIRHAWVEVAGMVYDRTRDDEPRDCDKWYAAIAATPAIVYTPIEAVRAMGAARHCGPWD